jgi:DNA-binding NtrC family response regulator
MVYNLYRLAEPRMPFQNLPVHFKIKRYHLKKQPLILIVDDDAVLCSLLATMVYTKNAQVLTAHSIAEADQWFNTGRLPAVVFLDQFLPDGSGIEYVDRLNKLDKKIKVIMMTGDDDKMLQQQALTQGCTGFLEKPFSYLKVSELLEKALRSGRSRFRLV